MSTDTFYFIVYADFTRTAIAVIDLAYAVGYERDEWLTVNDQDFQSSEEAIEYAKALAARHKLRYIPFESRYDSSLNERHNLTLD